MKFSSTYQNREANRWFSDRGDYTLRLDYNLNQESVVFDLGGYQGWFAESINNKFGSKVYVFEPSISLYENMNKKFKNNLDIELFNYGLSDVSGEFEFLNANEGSCIAEYGNDSVSNNIEIVNIKAFSETYESIGIDTIDLLKINVEGAEYPIMSDIFKNNLQCKIKNFQIQFHHISDDCDDKLISIRNELSKTHVQKWNYDWVWESWEIIA